MYIALSSVAVNFQSLLLPHYGTPLSFVALSHCFLLQLSISVIFGFPLHSGNRAQLSADAGQRRPSQKEKYVSPYDYLSP